ncbi:unnamed protein product [Rhizophagus irregularis]|nr:unnamed protein product [Rhizophagus irregularis]CAB5360712.1 unnamed protein product [Rhizophagus irregularis]
MTSITSKNKKKVLSASNKDVIASESTLTHKEITQTIIDLSDDLTEPTKDPPIKGTKCKKQVLKIKVKSNDDAKWTDSEIKILLKFWKENLEE